MRKIIHGHLYDTKTAEKMHERVHNETEKEILYKTKNDNYFLYKQTLDEGKQMGLITDVDEHEAANWLEEYSNAETYLKYFTAAEA